jgi:hypothetical protein
MATLPGERDLMRHMLIAIVFGLIVGVLAILFLLLVKL